MDVLPRLPSDRLIKNIDEPELDPIPNLPNNLPEWLQPSPDDPYVSHPIAVNVRRELELRQFDRIFETVCERIASGQALDQALETDSRDLNMGRFIRWVMSDPGRTLKYREVQKYQGEVMFSTEMVRIADALDNELVDVNRSKLMLDTRWKQLAVVDRDRFGDIKRIDQNVTVDLTAAMRDAEDRVRVIEADYE